MASESSSSIPFPKWQLALALGATGLVGLSYWFWKQNDDSTKKNHLINKLNSMSLEDVNQEIDPNETPLQKAQRVKNEGNAFFKKGKFEDAIIKYQEAIDNCPIGCVTDLSTFYQNKAAANEQLKRWPQVIEDCSKALELNERYEKALFRRAKAYEIQEQWDLCLEDVTAVCLLQGFQNPTPLAMADRALKELGRLHAKEAMKDKKPVLTSKQFIKTYFMSFSNDPVYELLMDTKSPLGEGELRGFQKAKLDFALSNFDDIIVSCSDEINSSESEGGCYFEALSLRASFLLLSGCQKEALDDLNTIIKSNDVDVGIKINSLIKRASIHMQLNDITECLKDFDIAAGLGPNVADVFHHRGQINLLMEKTQEARDDFEKAVSLNPDFAIAVVQKYYADYRYAMLTQNFSMLVQNMEDFRSAIEKFKNVSEAFVLFGQVLGERQEFEQAEKMYIRALEVEPDNATILVHRGLLELQWKGDVEKGVEYMKKAIKMDDRCGFAFETLATVEVQRGNLLVAIDLFNKGIELARTEMEMVHLFSLKDAAVAQLKICNRLNVGPGSTQS